MHIEGARILVTGGAGLIGSHIADLLVQEKAAEVVIFDNFVRAVPAEWHHHAGDSSQTRVFLQLGMTNEQFRIVADLAPSALGGLSIAERDDTNSHLNAIAAARRGIPA